MATDAEIGSLRRMTALEEDDQTYTDTLLGGLLDDLGFAAAAAQVWREKAAAAAGLVDMTESGSSRSLSQLREAYLGMAEVVAPQASETRSGASFTVAVERG